MSIVIYKTNTLKKEVIIIGGGAAGFFAAINLAEKNLDYNITIIEKSNKLLSKVKISGGGRCNVTHACFNPKELIKFYPRGGKELLGPFHQFMPTHVMEWFEQRGVPLKIEKDNRVFPVSDSSQTIIDCFLNQARRLKITINTNEGLKSIAFNNHYWEINTTQNRYIADKVLIATGSSPQMWSLLQEIGHTIIEPVPSLFTFNIEDIRLKDIPGVALQEAQVNINGQKFETKGPLLITHWGLSGPAILKLSAFAARWFSEQKYTFSIRINWAAHYSRNQVLELLEELKIEAPKQKIYNSSHFDIPKRLWNNLCAAAQIPENKVWLDISKKEQNRLFSQLTEATFEVNGKSTNKDEFVTSGGISLNEIDFKRFESKLHPNLYFAGEVLDIDAVTGGFNFQNAWTSAWIAAEAM